MASSSVSTATHLLFRSLLGRHLRLSTTAHNSPLSLLHQHHHYPKLSFSKLPSRFLFLSSSLPVGRAISTAQSEPESGFEEIDDESDELEEELEKNEKENVNESSGIAAVVREEREVPKLTVKEKKDLGSYANSLGDKLKSQQIGKSGVTDNVIFALSETLEANELLKLKIHRSCPGELEDIVSQLERGTGSVAVFQIGRIVIFYRPSLTKLKAEEKKEQARRLFAQKRKTSQAAFMMRRREQPKQPGSSYRGGRKFERSPS